MFENFIQIIAMIVLSIVAFLILQNIKTIKKVNFVPFLCIVIFVAFITYVYLNRTDKLDKILSFEPNYIEAPLNPTVVNYQELARYTQNYKGKAIIVTGKVSQVLENGVRIDMDRGEFGIWKNSIYIDTRNIIYIDINTKKEFKLLDEDIIKVVGIGRGERQFLDIFKNKKSIPSVEALKIDLMKFTN